MRGEGRRKQRGGDSRAEARAEGERVVMTERIESVRGSIADSRYILTSGSKE